jgi:ribulose-phosphate 3-epimerase
MMEMVIRIAPSILSADFGNLARQIKETEDAGADRVHVDVMDGHFVPNLSMGPAIVKSLRAHTRLPMEVHLMVEEPARFIDAFGAAGAASLIIHLEPFLAQSGDPRSAFAQIKKGGRKVGAAVRPKTAIAELNEYLAEIDVALCMTVEPGYAGQPFLPQSPSRIRELRQLIETRRSTCDLEVDGGIDFQTASSAVEAGANVLVAATAIFGHREGPAAAVRQLRTMFERP